MPARCHGTGPHCANARRRERLDEIQRSPEFERLQTRAGMIVDGTGVVHAYTSEALGRLMGHFEEAASGIGG